MERYDSFVVPQTTCYALFSNITWILIFHFNLIKSYFIIFEGSPTFQHRLIKFLRDFLKLINEHSNSWEISYLKPSNKQKDFKVCWGKIQRFTKILFWFFIRGQPKFSVDININTDFFNRYHPITCKESISIDLLIDYAI